MSESDTLTVYTTSMCGDCVAVKRALDARRIPFTEVRLEEDASAVAFVMSVNDGRRSVPTLAHRGRAASLSRFSPRRLDAFLAEAGLVDAGLGDAGPFEAGLGEHRQAVPEGSSDGG
ncbi:MAG: glutaredoxin family protein [Trueperaceae bacterium]|nr:glutaredoxin family protein [Trueperaceae bacterium]